MKKSIILAIAMFAFLGFSTFAAGQDTKFEEKKAEIVKQFDERIARDQQIRACVQSSNNPAEMGACRDKFKPPKDSGTQGKKEGEGEASAPGSTSGGK